MNAKKIYFVIVLMTASVVAPAQSQVKLMLFGGKSHDVYLGCLNCSDMSLDSVHNDIGRYGSDISPLSIFDDIGRYGSTISSESACNDMASDPPVIVDQNGGFYGYLTLNDMHSKAVTDPSILAWLKYKVCKVQQ
ncbi:MULTISPECIES: hypothetical protein [Burkholderia cepacia complex]|uniref:hypothetical protein n=1 Tax=Burkholderia cepacia complex TaxID=87882 RepID=UPI000BA6FC6D|nr:MULTISPECIES: hypothetical protein [Burkholderia cepacia complex]PAJ87276.1 hypothetical protein CJO70_12165 [Burkholderia ubonensis]PAK09874.1 hypothetical protein CJO67_02140 [Burkholderia ubonensis]